MEPQSFYRMDWRSSFGPIVSATWLNEQLKQLPDDLKILDSSSTPLKGGRDDFLRYCTLSKWAQYLSLP